MNLTALDGSGKVQLISCTSGNPEARRALTRLHVGDSVAIAGRATLHVYQRREDASPGWSRGKPGFGRNSIPQVKDDPTMA